MERRRAVIPLATPMTVLAAGIRLGMRFYGDNKLRTRVAQCSCALRNSLHGAQRHTHARRHLGLRQPFQPHGQQHPALTLGQLAHDPHQRVQFLAALRRLRRTGRGVGKASKASASLEVSRRFSARCWSTATLTAIRSRYAPGCRPAPVRPCPPAAARCPARRHWPCRSPAAASARLEIVVALQHEIAQYGQAGRHHGSGSGAQRMTQARSWSADCGTISITKGCARPRAAPCPGRCRSAPA